MEPVQINHVYFLSLILIFFLSNIHSQEWVKSESHKYLLSLFPYSNYTSMKFPPSLFCLPIFNSNSQVFSVWPCGTAENLVLQFKFPYEILIAWGWFYRRLHKSSSDVLEGTLCVHSSRRDNLRENNENGRFRTPVNNSRLRLQKS